MVGARVPPELLAALDAWAATHGKGMPRAEAIHRLVELGLQKGKGKAEAHSRNCGGRHATWGTGTRMN
jgi:hypothetical protein